MVPLSVVLLPALYLLPHLRPVPAEAGEAVAEEEVVVVEAGAVGNG